MIKYIFSIGAVISMLSAPFASCKTEYQWCSNWALSDYLTANYLAASEEEENQARAAFVAAINECAQEYIECNQEGQ